MDKKKMFLSRADKIMSMLPPVESDLDTSSDSEDEVGLLSRQDDHYINWLNISAPFVEEVEGIDDNLIDLELETTDDPIRESLTCEESVHPNSLIERNGVPQASTPLSDISLISSLPSEPSTPTVPVSSAGNFSGQRKSSRLKSFKSIHKNSKVITEHSMLSPQLPLKKAKKCSQFTWENIPFTGEVNIPETTFTMPANILTPINYFKKFFDDDLMSLIVENTNLYSVQSNCGNPFITTCEELSDFLSILLIMGIVPMPAYTDYWSNSFRYDKIASVMPLKRFERLRRYIHFVDNSLDDKSDLYFKVRPLLNAIRNNCLKFEEENRFSVDEMMIAYKGKRAGSRRQYLKNKPIKWGYKMFVRAGISGYVYDFLIYGGKNTFPSTGYTFSFEEEALGLGGKVVLALCKSIKNPACKALYFDNFFASPLLISYLRENLGILSLGTLRSNRTEHCDLPRKHKLRGDHIQKSDNKNNVTIVQWMDNKPVILASSYVGVDPVSSIERYDRNERKKIKIPCPQIVHHYNTHMGGVDLCDMLISLYKTKYKCRKWYFPVFIQMIDISVNNSWLLYRREMTLTGKGREIIPLKHFRLKIAESLLSTTKKPGRPSTLIHVPKKISFPVKSRPPQDIREDNIGHLPDFTNQGRCRFCTTGKTTVKCSKCDVRLCFVPSRNCFALFHTRKQ